MTYTKQNNTAFFQKRPDGYLMVSLRRNNIRLIHKDSFVNSYRAGVVESNQREFQEALNKVKMILEI